MGVHATRRGPVRYRNLLPGGDPIAAAAVAGSVFGYCRSRSRPPAPAVHIRVRWQGEACRLAHKAEAIVEISHRNMFALFGVIKSGAGQFPPGEGATTPMAGGLAQPLKDCFGR